jgi:cysteine synthase
MAKMSFADNVHTGGSTGASLALICAAKDYRLSRHPPKGR